MITNKKQTDFALGRGQRAVRVDLRFMESSAFRIR